MIFTPAQKLTASELNLLQGQKNRKIRKRTRSKNRYSAEDMVWVKVCAESVLREEESLRTGIHGPSIWSVNMAREHGCHFGHL